MSVMPSQFCISYREEFSCVKRLRLPRFLHVIWGFVRSKKSELFHPFEVLGLHEFFVEGVMLDWLDEGLKSFEEKKGRMKSNTWQYDCVFWEILMERRWWKKENAAFGLRFASVYHLEVLFSYVAVAWWIFFFWDD